MPDDNPYAPPQSEDPLVDAMRYRDYFEEEEEFQSALAIWPVCPTCGRRRLTRCPICKTAGNLFPLADADYWDPNSEYWDEKVDAILPSKIPEAPKYTAGHTAGHAHGNCPSCGSSGENCAPPPSDSDNQLFWGMPDLRKDPLPRLVDLPSISVQNPESATAANAEESADEINGASGANEANGVSETSKTASEPRLALVTCYVCDEPFVPKFPSRCEWCGYAFGDRPQQGHSSNDDASNGDDPNDDAVSGSASDRENSEKGADGENSSLDEEIVAHHHRLHDDGDTLNGRVLLVLGMMAALFCGALLYFWWLFR